MKPRQKAISTAWRRRHIVIGVFLKVPCDAQVTMFRPLERQRNRAGHPDQIGFDSVPE
jgi:hypothetical protein